MNKPKRILIVDDVEVNRELLEGILTSLGHESEMAEDGVETLAKLKLDIDLVLLDVQMPGMDGFEVARRIREDPDVRDIPIIMVTALTSRDDRLRAVEAGANDFITKPVDITEVRVRTASLLKMKEAQDAIKQYQADLEKKVEQRTADLRKALEDMAEAQRRTEEAHLDTIHRLAVAAELKDPTTAAHLHRISHYCGLLAKAMSLPPGEVELIIDASPMHDVGKIGTPDAILLKPAKLDEHEWEVIKQHAILGSNILSDSTSKLLQVGGIIALSHHEKWDGSGYPQGLSGEDIPLFSRICAIADVFDALTTERPYKTIIPNEESKEIMKAERGTHFDPGLLDLFFDNFAEVLTIQKKHRNNI
jgi:putative two-component system response regulator